MLSDNRCCEVLAVGQSLHNAGAPHSPFFREFPVPTPLGPDRDRRIAAEQPQHHTVQPRLARMVEAVDADRHEGAFQGWLRAMGANPGMAVRKFLRDTHRSVG